MLLVGDLSYLGLQRCQFGAQRQLGGFQRHGRKAREFGGFLGPVPLPIGSLYQELRGNALLTSDIYLLILIWEFPK